MLAHNRVCLPSRSTASPCRAVVHHQYQRRTSAHAAPSDDKQPSSSGSGATAETSAGLKAVWYAAEVRSEGRGWVVGRMLPTTGVSTKSSMPCHQWASVMKVGSAGVQVKTARRQVGFPKGEDTDDRRAWLSGLMRQAGKAPQVGSKRCCCLPGNSTQVGGHIAQVVLHGQDRLARHRQQRSAS